MITRVPKLGYLVEFGTFRDTRKTYEDAQHLLAFVQKNNIGNPKPYDLGIPMHHDDD